MCHADVASMLMCHADGAEFEEQCEEDKSLAVVLICSVGGSLEPVRGSPSGVRSRSLITAQRLLNDGYENVSGLLQMK
jgi:hypothetical protein